MQLNGFVTDLGMHAFMLTNDRKLELRSHLPNCWVLLLFGLYCINANCVTATFIL